MTFSASPPSPIGALDATYEIVEKIADGGMGAIYKVRHRLVGAVRVVKVLHPHLEAQPDLRARFLREARAAAELSHPNIVKLIDYTVADDGRAFIVLDFVPGVTLAAFGTANRDLPVPVALEIAHQALGALSFLHANGFVHRDVSPDNFILSHAGGNVIHLTLIDLGIAKPTDAGSGLTQPGFFLGKLEYASPEHFSETSDTDVDSRSDLYSLAVVLYELMTGVHPFAGARSTEDTDALTIIQGHLFRAPIPFSTSDPQGRIGASVRRALLTALEKEPEKRFQGAAQFDRALMAAAGERGATPAAILEQLPATVIEEPRPPTGSALGQVSGAAASGPAAAPPARLAARVDVARAWGPRIGPFRVPAPLWRPLPLALVGAALVGLTVAGTVLLARRGGPPRVGAAAPVAAPVAPQRPAGVPVAAEPRASHAALDPHLESAESFLATGDPDSARRELASIPEERRAAFSAAEREHFERLWASLQPDRGGLQEEELAKDLAAGLRHGDLDLLSAAVVGAETLTTVPAETKRDLERAKRALGLAAKLGRAQAAANDLDVLRTSSELQRLLPAYAAAAQAREQAAAAVESAADAEVAGGQYDRAQADLKALQRAWLDRPKLAERLAHLSEERLADARQKEALAQAASYERARQPLQGLDLLAGVTPNARQAEPYRQQRERLKSLLAQMDSEPPQVKLVQAVYKRGAVAHLQLEVTDDFMVKGVECYARAEGGDYLQVPVVHGTGASYTVDIPPAVHQNKVLELYVTATDPSGHRGELGNRQKPCQLRRESMFEQVIHRDTWHCG
jgi:serine/threonine-protein kinase